MSEDVHLAKVLLDVPLFEDLDYQQVQTLIEIGDRQSLPRGTVLCEPRTIDERLIVLLNGQLRLESGAGDLLDYIEPVRVTGEMGVFTGQIRSTKVVVEDTADVIFLASGDLDEMLEEDPQVGNHILANLIKLLYARIYDVNQDVEELRNQVDQLRKRLEHLSPGDPLLQQLFPEL